MKWLLAVGAGLVLLAIIAVLGETDTNPTAQVNSASVKADAPAKERASPKWHVTKDSDPITGKTSAYALSPRFKPVRKMEFPYGDTQMTIGFGCDSGSEWGYLTFTNTPNLVNDETKDGYSLSSSRVRWDDVSNRIELRQRWGDDALHFVNAASVIGQVMRNNTMLVELDWYGSGQVYFEAALAGSTAAISQARTICRPHIRRNQAR